MSPRERQAGPLAHRAPSWVVIWIVAILGVVTLHTLAADDAAAEPATTTMITAAETPAMIDGAPSTALDCGIAIAGVCALALTLVSVRFGARRIGGTRSWPGGSSRRRRKPASVSIGAVGLGRPTGRIAVLRI